MTTSIGGRAQKGFTHLLRSLRLFRPSASAEWEQELLQSMFQTLIGREPDPEEKEKYLGRLDGHKAFTRALTDIAASKSKSNLAAEKVEDLATYLVQAAYELHLKRSVDSAGREAWVEALKGGLGGKEFLERVMSSDEAKLKRGGLTDCSDGEFLIRLGPILFNRGLSPHDIASMQIFLNESVGNRTKLIDGELGKHLQPDIREPEKHDFSRSHVMGTDIFLTRDMWEKRRQEIAPDLAKRRDRAPRPDRQFRHSGKYKVSIITSLYKGERYISSFLENICSQSIFDQCELIIIDANSPEDESITIARFVKDFENIVYKRINYRVGIYDAWNEAVCVSRGQYLTNANLDDTRQNNSVELQADYLDQHPAVDIVYQDLYYSLDPNIDFEQIRMFDFKSKLPIITPANLMRFNSPHNAPMWRKALHSSIGLFDTKYRSAGDWEFWCRCLSNNCRFGKINTPHVAYFHNPEGLSTQPESPTFEEIREITTKYSKKLVPLALLKSRKDFTHQIGLDFDPISTAHEVSHYDLAQMRLKELVYLRGRNEMALAEDGPILVLVDGALFQLANENAEEMWSPLLAILAADRSLRVMFLDRGARPSIDNILYIDFPSYHQEWTSSDSLLIQQVCDDNSIQVFISTHHTTAVSTPQVCWLSTLEFQNVNVKAREAKEIELSILYSAYILCGYDDIYRQLLRCYPMLDASRVAVPSAAIDDRNFHCIGGSEHYGSRSEVSQGGKYLVVCAPKLQMVNHALEMFISDAVRRLRRPFVTLWFVGDDTIPQARGNGMPASVLVKRRERTGADLATAFREAFAYLHISPGEPETTMIEAMACGCPVITTQCAMPQEAEIDAVIAVSGTDAGELALRLDRLEDLKLRKDLIRRGFEQASKFRSIQTADSISRLIKMASGERSDREQRAFYENWRKVRSAQAAVDVGE